MLPTCAWTTGQYGISEVYLGVPAKLGRGGVTEIVELDLNDDERSSLQEAAEAIRLRRLSPSRGGWNTGERANVSAN